MIKKVISLTIFALFIAIIPLQANAYSQSFTSDNTWTVPTGVTSFKVEVWGAGGAGGGSDSGHGDGAGGGGGGYTSKNFTNITSGTNYIMVVGAGGIGVNASNGGDGGISFFKKSIDGNSLNYSTDLYASGGEGGSYTSSGVKYGGAGGNGYNGDINYSGHKGEDFVSFPMGDGGVPGDVNNNPEFCSSSIYNNVSVCRQGYQDNNPGDNFGNKSGLDFSPSNYADRAGDSRGSDGYIAHGGSPSRANNRPGNGGNGRIIITYTLPPVTPTPVTPPPPPVNPPTPVTPHPRPPVIIAMNAPYPSDYYNQSYNQTSPLGVSCYSIPTSGNVGDNITWRASAYGGNGNYYITWSGIDGLSGYGTSIMKTYNSGGSKYASITVTSGNQTISKNCGNNVEIYDYNNNYYNNNNNYNYNNYSNLSVSCYANTSSASTETNIVWSANASGGNGNYSYRWYGTDSLNGYDRTVSAVYHSLGIKTASVTVTSNNQSITQSCSNSVNINSQYYSQYNYNNSNNIQIACYADKTGAKVGSPVTWAVEATGATGNFSYSWSGSESLSGNLSSIVKIYSTTGTKNATVSVTSSNGQMASQICGNVVTVSKPTVIVTRTNTPRTNTVPPVVTNQNNNQNESLTASLFSLKNIPWGWVAVLIILVLFGTVLYLLFSKRKI